MSAIGKGDWVQCINAAPVPTTRPANAVELARLSVGQLYRVTWVGMSSRQIAIVRLQGHGHAPGIEGYRASRFRPIYRPKADFIESLKAPPVKAPRTREDA